MRSKALLPLLFALASSADAQPPMIGDLQKTGPQQCFQFAFTGDFTSGLSLAREGSRLIAVFTFMVMDEGFLTDFHEVPGKYALSVQLDGEVRTYPALDAVAEGGEFQQQVTIEPPRDFFDWLFASEGEARVVVEEVGRASLAEAVLPRELLGGLGDGFGRSCL